MMFLLEFDGNLTTFAILFYLRNPAIVSMFFYFKFDGNLTIVAIFFICEIQPSFNKILGLNVKEI